MSTTFYPLPVKEIRQETPDTVTVLFEIPEEHRAVFQYKHGQYLTLQFEINGVEERRAYSMSSSPLEPEIAVTVKRVAKGVVSNYIADSLKVGNVVSVMPPEGRFTCSLDADSRKTYYLIGAGSGITPLMSILKTILEEEPQSSIHLLYGNRMEDSIIFRDTLKTLETRYAGQLKVDHILSQPKKEKSKGFGGLLSKGKISWEGKRGRIDEAAIAAFLEENPMRTRSAEYFICGPSGMMQCAESFLKTQDIPSKQVHLEYFTPAGTNEAVPGDSKKAVDNAKVQVELDGREIDIVVPAGKSILDVLLEQKADPPYSCTSGACSSCMAKLTEGSVNMEVCLALDEEEVAEGFILTCQAHPSSATLKITYDV